MKRINRSLLFAISIALLVASGFTSTNSTSDSKYRVFCANKKIEVEQQKSARGSDVCVLGEFDYLSDAEKLAEQKGGKGAECSCP